jgi:hypothetical protein
MPHQSGRPLIKSQTSKINLRSPDFNFQKKASVVLKIMFEIRILKKVFYHTPKKTCPQQ